MIQQLRRIKMIIVKIIGGLGNQMFQYAAGRRAAYVNNTDLRLDITGYEKQEGMARRKYLLNIFRIRENFANDKEIQQLKKQKHSYFFRTFPWLASRIAPFYRWSYIQERYFHFDPFLLTTKDNSYIEGYWVSEKYFKDIENVIRREFSFKTNPIGLNKRLIDEMCSVQSVSIHFRRRDYLTSKKTRDRHGVCSLEYYQTAIRFISQQISRPHFFVFSDDPNWVKNNFLLRYPMRRIHHNLGSNDCEDLRLMSMCKHNIIANSTFGWWAAWLNQHKEKIVVSPKKWFNTPSINTNDVVPSAWIRL